MNDSPARHDRQSRSDAPAATFPIGDADYYTRALRDGCPIGLRALSRHLLTVAPVDHRPTLDWLWSRPLPIEEAS